MAGRNEVCIADYTGTSPSDEEYLVYFAKATSAGVTAQSWPDSAYARSNPIRYLGGSKRSA